jgi:hypothetical protein
MSRYDDVNIVLRPNVPEDPKRKKLKNTIKKCSVRLYLFLMGSLEEGESLTYALMQSKLCLNYCLQL